MKKENLLVIKIKRLKCLLNELKRRYKLMLKLVKSIEKNDYKYMNG